MDPLSCLITEGLMGGPGSIASSGYFCPAAAAALAVGIDIDLIFDPVRSFDLVFDPEIPSG